MTDIDLVVQLKEKIKNKDTDFFKLLVRELVTNTPIAEVTTYTPIFEEIVKKLNYEPTFRMFSNGLDLYRTKTRIHAFYEGSVICKNDVGTIEESSHTFVAHIPGLIENGALKHYGEFRIPKSPYPMDINGRQIKVKICEGCVTAMSNLGNNSYYYLQHIRKEYGYLLETLHHNCTKI